jgi:signal transduction histidine kinase/ligand-binding sensor domain-containing protein
VTHTAEDHRLSARKPFKEARQEYRREVGCRTQFVTTAFDRWSKHKACVQGLLLTLTALCFFSAPAMGAADPVAQAVPPEYLIQTWSTEDGLPENSATAVVQSHDGYIWFGTFRGLVRFNGVSFTVFDPANTPQMPDGGIANLFSDKRGRLWVGTFAGLVIKDGSHWRALGTNEGWAGNYVRTFTDRANGDLLITTFDGHVLAFENERLTELPPPPGERGQGYLGTVDENGQWWVVQNRFVGRWNGQQWIEMITPGSSVRRSAVACAPARSGGIWVLLAEELLKFRQGSEVSRRAFPQLKGGLWSMCEDSRSNLWISSYDWGLFRVSSGGDLHRWTTTNGLGSISARGVFEDREGNLWLGSSGGGLTRFTERRFLDTAPGSVLSGTVARSVSSARDGGMWIATYDRGLLRQDEAGVSWMHGLWRNNRSAYGLSVLEDRAGRLWYGDVDGFWWRADHQTFEKVPIKSDGAANATALYEDSQGRIWMGTKEGTTLYNGTGFQQMRLEAGLPRGEITGFGEDSTGRVWLAGAEGVFRWEQERFVQVSGTNGLRLRGVLCLKGDADGSMWMGTRDGGVLRWRNGTTDRVTVENGLPGHEIRGILDDGLGYFWMPSNRGIIRASKTQLRAVADGTVSRLDLQNLDKKDGLPSPECFTVQPIGARDAGGRLWFATQKGVAVIDPASFRLNSCQPSVQVEQMTYRLSSPNPKDKLGRSSGLREHEVRLIAPFREPVELPPGSYGLDIEYAVLSYTVPEKVQVQYQLAGKSPDWIVAGNRRLARFHQLPPDEYVFRVRAANNDGVWNETGASLTFKVLPFYWQTPWFRIGTALLLVGLGGLFAWSWSRRRVLLALEREKTAHEVQQLRDELAHSSRVSTMGQLASSLAHELNQPLGAILRNAEAAELLMEQNPPDLAEIRAILADIRLDDERAGGVINRMRSLLKRQKAERSQLSTGDLLQEVGALACSDALRRNVKLTVDASPGLPPVQGDRVQLQQVLLNLFLNGMDAMSEQPPERRRLIVQARQADAHRIEVSVRDFGTGISKPSLARLFEPFFSTKPHGMGLGLPISRTIIEAHQGKIWAENRPDGGACFYFTLPVAGGGGTSSK